MKKVVGYPLPLGVSERNDIVNFSISVESGKKCSLCIYKKGEELPKAEVELPEDDAIGEVRFAAFQKSDLKGMEYCYKIEDKYVLDPYVKSISENEYGRRGIIMTDSYDWEDDKPLRIPYHEVIAYNMHVRGFTKHTSSKVKKKGTFLGVIEKIPYLKELGINQIQCMPVYHFEENSKYTNYWGYGDAFCFAVKDTYAAGKNAGKELKDMVKACHKAGIEVVLNLPFTEKTPKRLIIECLQYYVMEYHVDGFVLNPYNAPMELVRANPILKHTKILQNKDDFQNVMRRFLKGDEDMVPGAIWWLSKNTEETGSCNYITTHTGFTLVDLVSYNNKHNELNGEENQDGPDENLSWNCGEEGPSRKKAVLELRKKQMRNAMFLMMMAQGTPSILAGDEFGNTQDGNNNVYCQDNEIAWLDWKKLEKETEFFEYVKKLIEIRKTYPILHAEKPLKGTDRTGYGVPDVSYHGESAWRPQLDKNSRQLGVYYHDADGTDLYIAYNMHYEAQKFALPTLANKKEWHLVVSTAVDVKEDVTCEKQILIEPRTILMFVGR
ncbi:MAG: glycogen debranching protein [Tyzzerella sp.]|nr:glycogen debranching protein [Tyzzerella sp.]